MALCGKGLRAEPRRPNILFIMVDQLRQPRWMPELRELPSIKRLREKGVEFTRNYCSAAPCSPSRACIMSGKHIPNHGVRDNVRTKRNRSLFPSTTTIGQVFQKLGYQTPYRGKWDLSHQDYLIENKLVEYGFEGWEPPDRWGKPFEGLIWDRQFAQEAREFLLGPESRKKPWLLTVSFINPHDIMYAPNLDLPGALVPDVAELPPNFGDDLTGKPSAHELFRQDWMQVMGKIGKEDIERARHFMDFYYYLAEKVDAQIGKVLEALDESGQAENTIVVFTSDHGEMACSHGIIGKGPFIYEENVNVPLIVSWPGHYPEGATTDAISSGVDLMPTLTAMTGADTEKALPQTAGKDLLPVIKSPSTVSVREETHFAFIKRASEMDPLSDQVAGEHRVDVDIKAVFEKRWKFAIYDWKEAEAEAELYDLDNDPLEMRNLAYDPAYQKIVKQLKERLTNIENRETGL